MACQNGYVHIMEGVPAPLPNMAAYLRTNENTKIFSKLLDRYSAPFEDYLTEAGYLTLQETYAGQNLYPALAGGERIYNRGYFFSSADGNSRTSFNGVEVNGLLKFDPSQNDYAEENTNSMGEASSNVNLDMGAIFAPTDEALREYWNGESGAFLRERYPSDEPFEKVPNDVLAEFMNNHMQYSFLSSLPSKFNLVLDDAKDPIGMEPADIEGLPITFDHCLLQVNGENDENFIDCLWGQYPLFVATGEEYVFDFRITESSPAREAGSTAYLNDSTATDLYGQPRPTDGTRPDIGASNYTPPTLDGE